MSTAPPRLPPVSTDEWIDRRMSRPLARALVALLRHTPITANQVTLLAALFGIGAGAGIARGTPCSLLAAAAGIVCVLVLDCADGQLARLRGGGARMGRLLDGLCDYVVALAVHVGAILFLVRTVRAGFPALPTPVEILLVVLSGGLLALRAGILDDLKGRVRSLTGSARDERDDPEAVRAEIVATRNAALRGLLRVYLLYCRLQARRGGPEAVPPERGTATIRAFRSWSLLGPSTHLIAMAAAAALAARWPDAIRWYFLVSVGPGALVTLALMRLR